MAARKSVLKNLSVPAEARVVGTIHSPGSLRHALRLPLGAVDVLELRVDHFADDPEALLKVVERLKHPLILTVRHPQEGGAGALSPARRLELYRRFLPYAALVDVELRSAARFRNFLAEVRAAGAQLIISDHHFRRMPSAMVMRQRFAQARKAGAEIVKVAARVETAEQVARLLSLLPGDGRPVSVMGMGPLGKASRLLFARAGSVLNYGYLDQPQVSGQWPATVLKERLREVMEEA